MVPEGLQPILEPDKTGPAMRNGNKIRFWNETFVHEKKEAELGLRRGCRM